MSQHNNRGGFSFMQMVVGAMALLKVKEKYDDCAYQVFAP